MATFKIQSKGTQEWSVEAHNYTLESDFFHFYSGDGQQVFAVRADSVRTIEAEDASA